MKTFFTSDTHFNHENILKYCRPMFKSLDEMNATIIERWNSVVGKDDQVYHLGDFAMGQKQFHAGFGQALNGKKTLIRGNHDRKDEHMLACGFSAIYSSILTLVDGKRIYMRHLPSEDLDDGRRPWLYKGIEDARPCDYFLCGHVHLNWKKNKYSEGIPIINVGVDQWDFTPRTLEELIA